MVECTGISKVFYDHKKQIKALGKLDFKIEKGEMVAFMGPSGSGKSTLLNILGGLIKQTEGSYLFNGEPVPWKERDLASFRNKNIGFVLQNFALIKSRPLFYNIALPLKYNQTPKEKVKEKVYSIAESLGISDKMNRYPYLLSGGECQRAAIARAIISNPSLLLADEPTSFLDDENKEEVLRILRNLNQEGMTVAIATHDHAVAQSCDRMISVAG